MSRSRRGGLTLTELLVAMSILLIGIYAVARGFPALFGTLEAEEIRTTMARAVEARMDRLKSSPQQIPAAIYGYDPADGALISPDAYPDADMEPIPGNPRDDLTRVVGERFRVPGLQGGATVAVYPLNIGPAYVPDPADVGATFQVYRLERLERVPMSQQDWITQGRPLDDDEFFLDSDGYLYAPPQYQHA
ncbi:MAG: prepilin-type N-terminal cleavage/methylation domain-containing protein, partial [candidate division WS1 bacterium]|nr:prepilin-type N-terminal cleavage/methylation domain-containing protein [candidate division WS1 bacterium]